MNERRDKTGVAPKLAGNSDLRTGSVSAVHSEIQTLGHLRPDARTWICRLQGSLAGQPWSDLN